MTIFDRITPTLHPTHTHSNDGGSSGSIVMTLASSEPMDNDEHPGHERSLLASSPLSRHRSRSHKSGTSSSSSSSTPTPAPTLNIAATTTHGSARSVFTAGTGTNEIAVVIPFIASQTHMIIDNSMTWTKYLPCSPTDDPNDLGGVHGRITLWLYYDGEFNHDNINGHGASSSSSSSSSSTRSTSVGFDGSLIRASMEQWFATLPSDVTRCFAGGLRFMAANLSSTMIHPDGPCQMFYTAFTFFEGLHQYNHLFWMEPDVLPVQSRWLTALSLEARDNGACQRFWQKGSISRCDASYSDLAARLDYHINGNAIYCLRDPGFADYRRRVQAAFPPREAGGFRGCATGKFMEGGFDHTFYRFRMMAENFPYCQHIIDKFSYTSFIQNRCQHEYQAEAIIAASPHTFLVHSKWAFYTKEEQLVRRAFALVMRREPEQKELQTFIIRLRFGEYSEEDILMKLCEKHQWPIGQRSDVAICIQLASRHRSMLRRYHQSSSTPSSSISSLVSHSSSISIPITSIIPPMNHSMHAPRHQEAKAEDEAPLSQVRHVEDGQADAHRLDPNYVPPSPKLNMDGDHSDPVTRNVVDNHELPINDNDDDNDDDQANNGDNHGDDNDDNGDGDGDVRQQASDPSGPSTGSFLTPFRAPSIDWKEKFPNRYYMWSNDFHPSPLVCNAPMYTENGMVIHGEIDFGHCIYFGLCRDRLKVLRFDEWRGFSLDHCPNRMRRDFFEAYKNDPEMARVDIVVCSHPAANCELFMPLNRTMIVYPSTRLEFGRDDGNIDWRFKYINGRSEIRWKSWLVNLRHIARNPRNIIAANNVYDQVYIKYFTGLDAMYLPSWCGDNMVSYLPTRLEILLGPSRDNLDAGACHHYDCKAWRSPILMKLNDAIHKHYRNTGKNYTLVRTVDLYAKAFTFRNIASHPAMVVLPYQVSVMTIYEVYRLNVPLFVPSQKLLLSWHIDHNYSWERVYGHPPRFHLTDRGTSNMSFASMAPPLPIRRPLPSFKYAVRGSSWDDLTSSNDDDHVKKDTWTRLREMGRDDPHQWPSPNSDHEEDFKWWSQFHDYYVWPHIQYFDNWEQLLRLLDTVDLWDVSRRMEKYNNKLRSQLKHSWKTVFDRALENDIPGSRVIPQDFDRAFKDLYGMDTPFPDDDQDDRAICSVNPILPRIVVEESWPTWLAWLLLIVFIGIWLKRSGRCDNYASHHYHHRDRDRDHHGIPTPTGSRRSSVITAANGLTSPIGSNGSSGGGRPRAHSRTPTGSGNGNGTGVLSFQEPNWLARTCCCRKSSHVLPFTSHAD